ncbi:MAG: spoIIIJ-associated protein [Candidatus Atribacteria bacterium]|nr:spoIIIJ-associated protein [Candidatus Atribacteria bacterium]
MQRSVEVSGKTLEEVLERSARYFEVPKEKLGYEIIAENKGFLGILSPKMLRVRVWIDEGGEKTEEESPQETSSQPVKASSTPDQPPDEDQSQNLARAREMLDQFLGGFLKKMEVEVNYSFQEKEGRLLVEIEGQDAGLLIGKRGETLEAIESFLKILLAKKGFSQVGLSVDISGYQKRQEENLKQLAQKTAQKVLQDKKRAKLRPMSAKERRIIHTALKDNPRVTTYSIGQEPQRRVVIDLKNGRKKANYSKKPRPKKTRNNV